MDTLLRGIFPVLQTPVNKSGDIGFEDMRIEVSFCIEAGAHGLVFPVLGSEFQYLTDGERHELVEIVVKEAAGRIPVVAGVAGTSRAVAVKHATHAAQAGADAVIALPPYIATASRDEIRVYYEAVANAAGLPVFIQHSAVGAGMNTEFLRELVETIEHVSYIKEEMPPSAHQISEVLEGMNDACLGVFGGAHGRWMISEMRRGAAGFMPAAEATDVHVQIWDAFQSGDESGARKIFNQLLPMINLLSLLGLRVCKEVLVRRGVFKSAAMRAPGSQSLDAEDERELDQVLEGIEPLFRWRSEGSEAE